MWSRKNAAARDVSIAVVGLPGSGKTSFLSALHGAVTGTTGNRAEWSVDADYETRAYLAVSWSKLRDGLPVQATGTEAHPELSLTLRRNDSLGKLTDVLALRCIDTAGEFSRSKDARTGPDWLAVAQRIRSANVLLLVVDAMNVLFAESGDLQGQQDFDNLIEMFKDACQTPASALDRGSRLVPLDTKQLAVCFSKCDAVSVVDIDGFEDDKDAGILAGLLIPQRSRKNLADTFPAIGFFGVSVLRDRWRWTRGGACVRVGDEAVEPVGIFEPFEWISGRSR